MKRWLIIAISALSIGCASVQAQPTKVEVPCDSTEGYEYYCYSNGECQEFLLGYAAIVKKRFVDQQFGWFLKNGPVQIIHVNLFMDHISTKLVGRMEAELVDNRIYLKYWGTFCDVELNVINSFYKEGFSKATIK